MKLTDLDQQYLKFVEILVLVVLHQPLVNHNRELEDNS